MNTFIALFEEKKTSINFIKKTHSLKILTLIPTSNSSNEINLEKKGRKVLSIINFIPDWN